MIDEAPSESRSAFLWVCAAVFKTRGLLMAPLVGYLLLHFDVATEESSAAWIGGLALFALGAAVRIAAQRSLRYRVSGERRLAQAGLYRFVRNPVYLGNMLILMGLALACELPWAALIAALWAMPVYHCSVRFEESRLAKRYGSEYRAYVARVPRWMPHVPHDRSSSDSTTATWSQVAAAEWHCWLLLLVPVAKEIAEQFRLFAP